MIANIRRRGIWSALLIVAWADQQQSSRRKHRQLLFPMTPLLQAAVDRRSLRDGTTDNAAAVAVANDPALTLESFVHLLPETVKVFVVIGTSRVEQFWRDQMAHECQRFEDRLNFVRFDELSFAEMLARPATLPRIR
jgi:hypothetical protein